MIARKRLMKAVAICKTASVIMVLSLTAEAVVGTLPHRECSYIYDLRECDDNCNCPQGSPGCCLIYENNSWSCGTCSEYQTTGISKCTIKPDAPTVLTRCKQGECAYGGSDEDPVCNRCVSQAPWSEYFNKRCDPDCQHS